MTFAGSNPDMTAFDCQGISDATYRGTSIWHVDLRSA